MAPRHHPGRARAAVPARLLSAGAATRRTPRRRGPGDRGGGARPVRAGAAPRPAAPPRASRWSSTSTSSGGVQTACDAGGAGEYAAAQFADVGHTLTYVQGQAFVCQVDGAPSTQCVAHAAGDRLLVAVVVRREVRHLDLRLARRRRRSRCPTGGYVALSWQKGSAQAPPRVAPAVPRTVVVADLAPDLAAAVVARRPARATARTAAREAPPPPTAPRVVRLEQPHDDDLADGPGRRPRPEHRQGHRGPGHAPRRARPTYRPPPAAAGAPDTSAPGSGSVRPARLGRARAGRWRCSSRPAPSPSYAGSAPAAPDAAPRGRPPAAGPAPRRLVALGGRAGRRRLVHHQPVAPPDADRRRLPGGLGAPQRPAVGRLVPPLPLARPGDRGDPGLLPDPRRRR